MSTSSGSDDSHHVLVLLGLGANLGDRRATLEAALARLEDHCGPLTRSAFYETPPWGDPDQPPFLNLVAAGRTSLAPEALLARCKQIEEDLGRTVTRRWGPRVADVDILAYGTLVQDTPTLTLPHPLLHRRAFVLVPLAEIGPGWVHPLLGRSARELLADLTPEELAGIHRVA